MMRIEPIFRTRRKEIIAYCNENGLDYEKLRKCGIFGGVSSAFSFQYVEDIDPSKPYDDSVPAPIVLQVQIVDGKLLFTQTEHTMKYIAKTAA